MAITWNIDEARATIRAQMAEANRLDEVIDDLSAETSAALARAVAAEAEIERLRAQVVTLDAQLQEVRTEYRVACEDFNELLEQTSDW